MKTYGSHSNFFSLRLLERSAVNVTVLNYDQFKNILPLIDINNYYVYIYIDIYFSDSQLRRIVKDGVKQIPMGLVVRYE